VARQAGPDEEMVKMKMAALIAVLPFAEHSAHADGAGRELIRDSHFQSGFNLLEPKPGKRAAYGGLAGFLPGWCGRS